MTSRFGRSVAYVGGGIGDVLMHAGHFEAIARESEGGLVAIACRDEGPMRQVFAGSPFVGDVIGLGNTEGKVRFGAAAAAFRARRFDTLFMLKSHAHISFAGLLAGIPDRIGYVRPFDPRALLLTRSMVPVGPFPEPSHLTKSDQMLDWLNLPFDTAACRLKPTQDAAALAKTVMGEAAFVAIGLNSSVPERQWGERFADLIAKIGAEFPVSFLLYGGADVRDLAARVREQSALDPARFVDIPARGDPLNVSHALLARCILYVGNDSSGLNMAVFCGLPAIGFFSVTPPFSYSPLFIPLEPDPAGSGIDGIRPEVVLAATRAALRNIIP